MENITSARQVLLTQEDGWYIAEDLATTVASQGKDIGSALDSLKEALSLYFENNAAERTDEAGSHYFLTTIQL
ncbi:MAG: hypothetical protein VZT48_10840 [Bulleidia sp.]|nr:hypothetical protein [Bulleidia sp.]